METKGRWSLATLPSDEARWGASGWAGPFPSHSARPQKLGQRSLSSDWPPFPVLAQPPNLGDNQIASARFHPVTVHPRDADPSAASLPISPEHRHQPTWMTLQSQPWLDLRIPGESVRTLFPGTAPRGAGSVGVGRAREPGTSVGEILKLTSRLCTCCSLPDHRPVFPAEAVAGVRGQKETRQG